MSIRSQPSHVIDVSETSEPDFKLIHLFSPVYFIPAVTICAILFLLCKTYAIVNTIETTRPL